MSLQWHEAGAVFTLSTPSEFTQNRVPATTPKAPELNVLGVTCELPGGHDLMSHGW